MTDNLSPLDADRLFFSSLLDANLETLNQLLSNEFILIDILSGSEINKTSLLSVLKSGQVKFDAIELIESHMRIYPATALITGHTKMSGQFGETPFNINSRYTHVFIEQDDQWNMVAAQGTQISPELE